MQADIGQVNELARNISELRQMRWFPVHLKSPVLDIEAEPAAYVKERCQDHGMSGREVVSGVSRYGNPALSRYIRGFEARVCEATPEPASGAPPALQVNMRWSRERSTTQ